MRGLIGQPYEAPSKGEVLSFANLGRGVLQEVLSERQAQEAKQEADRKAMEERAAAQKPRRKGRKP